VKILLSTFVFLALMGERQDAGAPVPVEQEPLHHVVLKNASVVVLHLTLPAGARTLFHTHTHDRVSVHLSSTSITQQKLNEAEGAPTSTTPGTFSATTLEGDSFTHRVHNVGSQIFDVLDVELLQRPQSPSPAPAAPAAAENASARVYKWVLAPGEASATHTHWRPYLIVAATGLLLKTTANGQSSTREMKAGDFQWMDSNAPHTPVNAGTSEGQILEIELK